MFIMDEKEYIEKILQSNKMYKELGRIKGVLVKYYFSQGFTKQEVIDKVMEYFRSRTKGVFKENTLYTSIKYSVDKQFRVKKEMRLVEYIPISEYEMNIIKSLKNNKAEKFLFTLLAIAKYKNLLSEKNGNWTLKSISKLFSMANVCLKQSDQYDLIRDLIDRGYIELAKGENNNIKVLFIEGEDDFVKIDNFTDLGKFYMNLTSNKYIRCEECGKMVMKTCNKVKYCKVCAREINILKTIFNKKV